MTTSVSLPAEPAARLGSTPCAPPIANLPAVIPVKVGVASRSIPCTAEDTSSGPTRPRSSVRSRGKALKEYASESTEFASAVGIPASLAKTVYERVSAKLGREPVEDFRIDFEDGYGNRPDAEEDGHAAAAGAEVAKGLATGTLPPFIGIRSSRSTKSCAGEASARSTCS